MFFFFLQPHFRFNIFQKFNKPIPELLSCEFVSVFSDLFEGELTHPIVHFHFPGRLEIRLAKIIDLEFVLFEAIGGGSFFGEVYLDHFTHFPVNQVLTGFQFAEGQCVLGPIVGFLADDIQHGALAAFLHGAFCDALQHSIHMSIKLVLLGDAFDLLNFGHF